MQMLLAGHLILLRMFITYVFIHILFMYFSRSELNNRVQSTTENYANSDLIFLLSSSYFTMAKWIGTLMSLIDHFKQQM